MAATFVLLFTGCTPVVEVEADPSVRVRTFGLKSISRAMGHATGAVSQGVNQAGGAINSAFAEAEKESGSLGRSAMSSVTDEYRNASGQVIDAAGNIISYIPTSWPRVLDNAAYGVLVTALNGSIAEALSEVRKIRNSLRDKNAQEAEDMVNQVLRNVATPNPKIAVPGIPNPPVPVVGKLRAMVRPSEWETSYAMNVTVDVDFLGIKTYHVKLGCVGFPQGFSNEPRISFNGGCNNPWRLLENANIVANTVKDVAVEMGDEIMGIEDQLLGILKGIAKDAENPRMIPAIALDIPVNQLLGMLSPGFSSSKAADDPPENPEVDAEENSAINDAIAEMGANAALEFTVPQLGGISFEMSPDLSPVAYFDNWNAEGQMDIGVELGLFGILVAGVKMGCVTFGEKWDQVPKFSFDGGCDKSWNVDFAAGGYTSSTHRIDNRAISGAAGPIPVAPAVAPAPAVIPASQVASGGRMSQVTLDGKKYQIHLWTINDDSEFYLPDHMANAQIEYLLVGGGGSGASNKTNKDVGVGGGGGGGILTNMGSPIKFYPGTYTIIVGDGGTGPYSEGNGLNGGNSSINGAGLVAFGGGGGGRIDSPANPGGSGGGAGYRAAVNQPGASLEGQGNAGSNGFRGCKSDGCSAGGGGGGAGGPGGAAGKGKGADGGPGRLINFNGNQTYFGAGGGGGGIEIGLGGTGGGGNGGYPKNNGQDAAANNTGAGGGGSASGDGSRVIGGKGGSGIVIIRYPIS